MLLRRVFSVGAAVSALLLIESASAQAPVEAPGRDQRSYYELLGEDDPNPVNLDFSFLSIAINQNFGITTWRGGGIYFGAGGGVGTAIYRLSMMGDRDLQIDPMIEAVFGNAYLRITPFKYLDVDVGGRLALGATMYDISDAPRGGFVRGAYLDLRVGTQNIKLGPRIEYDSIVYSDFTEDGIRITPLMLRIVN